MLVMNKELHQNTRESNLLPVCEPGMYNYRLCRFMSLEVWIDGVMSGETLP